MNQQYVLLRKENDSLNSLIGKSFNQKSKFEAEKILAEIHSKAERRSIGKSALCYVVDKNEILGVGGSTLMKDKNGKIFSNLILDQFGLWLAAIFKRQVLVIKNETLQDVTNTSRILNIYGGAPFNDLSGSEGIVLRVGQGSTVPTRADFTIETLFGTTPESLFFIPTTDPVWNTAIGNFKQNGSIIAGGAGTITESVLSSVWQDSGGTIREFSLFRDIISPGEPFILGQTIALEYTIQL